MVLTCFLTLSLLGAIISASSMFRVPEMHLKLCFIIMILMPDCLKWRHRMEWRLKWTGRAGTSNTSQKLAAASNHQPATSNQQPATCNLRLLNAIEHWQSIAAPIASSEEKNWCK